MTVEIMRKDKSACDLRCAAAACRDAKETVQKTSLGYAGGKPNPLNPPYQGDFPLNFPLIRGARGVKNDERWVSCTVSKAARRMLAIALILDGTDRKTAAENCGMDRQTLRDWVHRYNDTGIEGLSNRRSPGRQPLLSVAQKAELASLVREGPNPETDGVVRWRRIDLKRKIEKCFGVVMHERTVSKQLVKLGFRRLSVRPQHPKSDPDAQDVFKKTSLQR